jgi:muramidase (phage lysozyme)
MREDFAPTFGDNNWLLNHDNAMLHASFFTREFFYQKQQYCRPPPTLLFPFPRLKTKLTGRYFDTILVIEVESQAVLNTLREYDFQDAFKKCQKLWELCICAERNYLEADGGQ